ncbi:MAG: hypothetical protein CTY26_10535 [Methylophilus sp.]|nr:MAG: hypothetical protein CTY26_10535 [Methylophilus sp.]
MKAPAEVSAKRDILAATVSVNQTWLRGQIAALHGTRNPHVLSCTFRFLRAVRLALPAARSCLQYQVGCHA